MLARALAELPGQCEVCRGWCSAALCRPCLAAHARPRSRCARCGLPLAAAAPSCGACLANPPPQVRTVCALDYLFPWDRLIGQLKFGHRVDLAAPLAALLDRAVTGASSAVVEDAAGPGQAAPNATVVVPVPLSDTRLAQRGFNQAWELARHVARARGLHAAPRALQRVLDTPAQAGLTRGERQRNLRNAFAPASQAAAVAGRDVALVDDVMTTGSTAREAAAALLRAGARSVQLWVLARTPEAA